MSLKGRGGNCVTVLPPAKWYNATKICSGLDSHMIKGQEISHYSISWWGVYSSELPLRYIPLTRARTFTRQSKIKFQTLWLNQFSAIIMKNLDPWLKLKIENEEFNSRVSIFLRQRLENFGRIPPAWLGLFKIYQYGKWPLTWYWSDWVVSIILWQRIFFNKNFVISYLQFWYRCYNG